MSRESVSAAIDNARVVYTGKEDVEAGDGDPVAHDVPLEEEKVRGRRDAMAGGAEAGSANGPNVIEAKLAKARRGGGNKHGKSNSKAASPTADDEHASAADGFSEVEINREHALVLMGSKAVIVKQALGGPINDRQRVLTVEAFCIWFSNRPTEHRDADGKVKIVTWAQRWLKSPARRQYSGIEFFPDPANIPGTPGYLNLWRGFAVEPVAKPNGYSVFRDHLLNNVCGGDEALFRWVFAFFAHMIQRPRERIGVALVLRGAMGCGKTIVGEHFGALILAHYFLVDDPRYVTGQFNAHMASCLLLQADEAVWAGDKAAEGRLKGLVTSPIQQIEAKGVDPIRLANYVRLIMTSNESWVVPAGKDERRFAVLDVDPRCVGNHQYFAEMSAELVDGGYAGLLAELLAFDLSTVNLRDIPKTAALLDQKERSLDSVPAWWLGRLVSGRSTRNADGWVRSVKREAMFDDYIATAEKVGIKRRKEETIFGSEFRRLVPGLKTTRAEEVTRDHEGALKTARVRYYELPKLKDCRSAWDESMHQTRCWKDETEVDAQGQRESEIHDGRDF